MTKAAVYNAYWETGGGGEMYCGGVAQALAEAGYDVTLLASRPFDVAALSERLSLDLHGCELRVVGEDARRVSDASADYDLFVNGSYLSAAVNRAAHGLYIVHFPARPMASRRRRLRRSGGDPRGLAVEWGEGFHAPDAGGRVVWTSDRAEIHATSQTDDARTLTLFFRSGRGRGAGPARVEVDVNGVPAASATVPEGGGGGLDSLRDRKPIPVTVEIPGGQRSTITIRSNTFVPAELDGSSDRRHLGVRFLGIATGDAHWSSMVWPWRAGRVLVDGIGQGAYATYDCVVSNSHFTSGFVEEWMGIENSPVLYPPVKLREPGLDKRPVIASVGRFFSREEGHCKNQLELVRSFGRLLERTGQGWQLDLVGGVDADSRGYYESVQQAAATLPVRLHVDADGATRDRILSEASIFWHAAGYGSDPQTSPERMEHFGISTVEAMSAGAVPVVFGGGGQNEIVTDGAGYRFSDLEELIDRTVHLIEHPEVRAEMSASAVERAREFGFDRFSSRLLDLVESLSRG